MEVLQCDGCDFRAPSYEDLKAHIQDVHTAFLQPTDVAEDNGNEPRSGSMNASNQTEVEYSSIKDEFAIAEDLSGRSSPILGISDTVCHAPPGSACSCGSWYVWLLQSFLLSASHFCDLGIMFLFLSVLCYCPFGFLMSLSFLSIGRTGSYLAEFWNGRRSV